MFVLASTLLLSILTSKRELILHSVNVVNKMSQTTYTHTYIVIRHNYMINFWKGISKKPESYIVIFYIRYFIWLTVTYKVIRKNILGVNIDDLGGAEEKSEIMASRIFYGDWPSTFSSSYQSIIVVPSS